MVTTKFNHDLPLLALNAADIVARVMQHDRRVLLFGPMGAGKSTLAASLADTIAASGRSCWCLNADPGSPAFGVPGSVSIAKRQQGAWRVIDYAGLCTLDAGRFRLPLVSAVRALLQQLPEAMVLIDGPGAVRGIAGRELLEGLVEATAADAVLALTAGERPPPLLDELHALPVELFVVQAAAEAVRPGKRVRARQRTEPWDAHLAHGIERQFDLGRINLTGTPPPLAETGAWRGRQLALLQAGRTVAMGEVQHVEKNVLTAMLSNEITGIDTLLIRDAARNADGFIETAKPFAGERFEYMPPADVLPSVEGNDGPRIVGRVGSVDVALVNGVFGDALLHLRMRHQRRSLLFDLGDGSRLPARIAHQVTDVFISHAHMDHIGGFLWLLRSRLGDYPSCRLYGPPGLAKHIEGFLQGILWDRIENRGANFEVMELHGDRLRHFHLQAGYARRQLLDEAAVVNGILHNEPGFQIRGVTLDHYGTPVIAYAFEPDKQINIRKDRLQARGAGPGPWLNELKQNLLSGNETAMVQLPDGSEASSRALADELVLIMPGKKLVYATDLADTENNRRQLISLAQHAHTFFCEAAFTEADADHAMRNGHLTTRACGEIATQAGVSRLLPFHFSRRYADNPQQLYDEIKVYCTKVLMPKSMTVFETAGTKDIEPVVAL
ncbi:MAG: ATP/GTP-binding protein [Gammaproteobacteria bacterium]|nr:ATP/GTP-binding protein [Gammaproteobacteria bacterium]